jgi:hypothetical protein
VRRKLTTALSWLSLLLCVAAAAAWAGGYLRSGSVLAWDEDPPYGSTVRRRSVSLEVTRGRLSVRQTTSDLAWWEPSRARRGFEAGLFPAEDTPWHLGDGTTQRLGFGVGRATFKALGASGVVRVVTVPPWALALAFGLLPGWRRGIAGGGSGAGRRSRWCGGRMPSRCDADPSPS